MREKETKTRLQWEKTEMSKNENEAAMRKEKGKNEDVATARWKEKNENKVATSEKKYF